MDAELENRVNEAIDQLKKYSFEDIDFEHMDPIVKMMLVAIINEGLKIQDYIENTEQRIVERFCSDFIPYEKIEAVPAIALVNPRFKPNKEFDIVNINAGVQFTYKINNKQQINYIPLFNTTLIPFSTLFVITPRKMVFGKNKRNIRMNGKNEVWVGISTNTELDNLQGLSIHITGTNGMLPEHIYTGLNHTRLDFSSMRELENIEMVEPFDAQQASGQFFSFVNVWKEHLLNMEDSALLYVTDDTCDRDLFKPQSFPKVFQQWLEDEDLDCFEPNTIWLHLEFPAGYVVPDTCEININVLPIVNVDINSLTLTQATPIAKLQKQDDSFFLKIIETSSSSLKQGVGTSPEEIIIRDFDASCYHNGDLYRDVRNLYNRFIDDYYAFIEYNGIKDGETLKQLRATINRLGKSVGEKNTKFKFDSGTYVMKNMNQFPLTSSTKVSYMTTMGKIGNTPQKGELMENRKLPAIEQKVPIVYSAMAGTDKSSVDERYELMRYYSLTNDRLYTKMDIEAFLRKEIMAEFGKEEFKRVFVKISIEGAAGCHSLQRGLYIDIEFKDKKNYEKALNLSFDKLVKQKIEGKSCISMPIIVSLWFLDE